MIELLVVMGVIGILLALLVPAVQRVREAARRNECTSHLRQIGIGVWNYHAAHRMFPAGDGMSGTWLFAILPSIEQRPLYDAIRESVGAIEPAAPALYHCPSDNRVRAEDANYAGNFGAVVQRDGANGLFRHASSGATAGLNMHGEIRARDVTDGLSNTAMAAEVLAAGQPPSPPRVEWNTPADLRAPDESDAFLSLCLQMPAGNDGYMFMAGYAWHVDGMFSTFYTHHLPPNSPRCTNGHDITVGSYSPTSLHGDGANILLGDGHVEFVSSSTDRLVWQGAGSRDGNEPAPPL